MNRVELEAEEKMKPRQYELAIAQWISERIGRRIRAENMESERRPCFDIDTAGYYKNSLIDGAQLLPTLFQLSSWEPHLPLCPTSLAVLTHRNLSASPKSLRHIQRCISRTRMTSVCQACVSGTQPRRMSES